MRGGLGKGVKRLMVFFLWFRVFYDSPQLYKIALPLCMWWKLLFIDKNVTRSQTWSLNFFFFVKFDYYFLYFLKTSIINIDLMRKINDFKNDMFKVECVPKIFENLNSFETMLKILKTMQIY